MIKRMWNKRVCFSNSNTSFSQMEPKLALFHGSLIPFNYSHMERQKENKFQTFICFWQRDFYELRHQGFEEVVERPSRKSHRGRFLAQRERESGERFGCSYVNASWPPSDDKLYGAGTGRFSQLVGPIGGLIDGVDVLNRPPTRRVLDS